MSPSDERTATARLFLALWPDAGVRARLASIADGWRWPPTARRVPAANLHVTLHFIGACPRDGIEALCERLGRVAPRSIALAPAGTAIWPGGIAVMRLADDPALTALHRELGDALVDRGIALEARPYAPHVTFARKAAGAMPAATVPPLCWQAAGFSLVETRPGRAPRYVRLAAWGQPAIDGD